MKKLLLTSLLSLGLLIPTTFSASTNSSTSKTEFSTQTQKKKKKTKKRKARKSKSTASRGCTYNGHSLNVGPRGGCYYYSGNSKEYVDRSYCSGCN